MSGKWVAGGVGCRLSGRGYTVGDFLSECTCSLRHQDIRDIFGQGPA
jgi:hypothetical protein